MEGKNTRVSRRVFFAAAGPAALAMRVPGIVANESARQGAEQMKVPCFDTPQAAL